MEYPIFIQPRLTRQHAIFIQPRLTRQHAIVPHNTDQQNQNNNDNNNNNNNNGIIGPDGLRRNHNGDVIDNDGILFYMINPNGTIFYPQ